MLRVLVLAFRIVAALGAAGTAAWAQAVFINELHYDNAGTDSGEGVEIAGPAGTDLTHYDLVFYNGKGGVVYRTVPLSGNLPNQGGSGFGARWFPISGIQNGAQPGEPEPDGLALVLRGGSQVVHRLAYEGTFTGVGGPADGLLFSGIGVQEESDSPVGQSLQLTGMGTLGGHFAWSGPMNASLGPGSEGAINPGQTFGAPSPVSLLTFAPGLILEGTSTTATLSLVPAPAIPVTMTLRQTPPGLLAMPATVIVPVSGSVSFIIGEPADGTPDGFRQASILATAGAGGYPAAGAALQIVDADRPARGGPGEWRLATFNVKNGVGAPGSTEFAAVREVIERISPDVLLLQEVSDAGDFGDVQALLEQAGFPTGPAYLATTGDAFAGEDYSPGDFGDGECLATASRFPITSTIQIGRGVAGRREMTRFPLFTTIDLPGPDLQVINVHLKAGTADPDRFRKAVEAYRIREFLGQQGLSAATDNIVVAGDFNAIDTIFLPTISYNSSSYTPPAGTALPVSYQLGSDLATAPGVTLPYSVSPYQPSSSVYPHQGFNPAGLFAPTLFHADGVTSSTFNLFGARFDYFMFPLRLQTPGNARGEVYNSRLESQADGLPKRPTLPVPEISETASDHYAVFLDLNLSPAPLLSLSVSPAALDESTPAPPPLATVAISPAPAGPVTVQLRPWRDERVRLAVDTVVLTPSQPSVQVPVLVPFSPLVEPQRAITLMATANGYAPAMASLTVRSAEAAGLLVFSRYIEPSTPAAPPNDNASRALQLYNASGLMLDLGRMQWEVRRYTNGSTTATILAKVSVVYPENSSALLPAGHIIIIGDSTLGNALVSAGLLPAPSPSFAGADIGSLFCDASGQPVFLKGSNMDFNGNDALEIVADGVRCDVFGRIGQDPGTAWTGGPGNPSTADQNLALRPEIFTGSTGFMLPGTRFQTTASGNSLLNLGVPPSPTDRYLTWAASHALTGLARAPNSDPDRDGRLNLMEFIGETHPLQADPASGQISGALQGSFLTLNPDAWLSLGWERSETLSSAWSAAPEVIGSAEGATLTRWQWTVNPASASRRFWRLRAARP